LSQTHSALAAGRATPNQLDPSATLGSFMKNRAHSSSHSGSGRNIAKRARGSVIEQPVVEEEGSDVPPGTSASLAASVAPSIFGASTAGGGGGGGGGGVSFGDHDVVSAYTDYGEEEYDEYEFTPKNTPKSVFQIQQEMAAVYAGERDGESDDEGELDVYDMLPNYWCDADFGWITVEDYGEDDELYEYEPFNLLLWHGILLGFIPIAARERYVEHPPTTWQKMFAVSNVVVWQAMLWFLLLYNSYLLFSSGMTSEERWGGVAGVTIFRGVVRTGISLMAICLHYCLVLFFRQFTFFTLSTYAQRSGFIYTWALRYYDMGRWLLCVTIPAIGTAVASAQQYRDSVEWSTWVVESFSVLIGWLVICSWMLLCNCVIQFCSYALDAFGLNVFMATGLRGFIPKFNVLQAALRRAHEGIQNSVLLWLQSLLGMAFATVWHLFDSIWSNESFSTIFPPIEIVCTIEVFTLIMVSLWLAFSVADVNIKAKHLPGIINSLNFGNEIDHDKWCVVSYITSTQFGFYLANTLLTRTIIVKAMYYSMAVCLFMVSSNRKTST